ncbi:MAG: DNA polymerase I [Myxococcaceae bacterium]|nr:DNA polymerase I [Myxococcaceae bacterium]
MTDATSEARAQPPVLTLIDASGFIFRAYHAIQHLSTSKGVPTNAVYGFTRMILKTLRELSPTHVALAFDKESRLGRQAIDPTYKANREGPPSDLVPQFELIRRVVDALNLPVVEFAGWEADDVVGTLACAAKKQGYKVLIITGDKDFIQLVDEDVTLFDPMQDRYTDLQAVKEKYGITPPQMKDYLALVGDAIDNVGKVPGIGPKTATELLQQFGDVEALIARVGEVKKPKIREAIAASTEILRKNMQLVSMRLDLPIDTDIEKFRRRPIHEKEARALFGELEFFKLLQEMPAEAPTPLASETVVVTTETQLSELASAAAAAGKLAVIPTFEGPIDWAELIGLGLALPDGRTFYLPLGHRYLGAPAQLPVATVARVLGPIFADPAVKKAGHDLKILMRVLAANGMSLEGAEDDVEMLSYLLNPSRKEHALPDLTRERLRNELPPDPHQLAKKRGDGPSALSVEELAPWSGASADAARRLAPELWAEVEQVALAKLAREVELPLMSILAKMERAGVRLDTVALKATEDRVDQEAAAKLQEIFRYAGHEFQVNSPKELCTVLFDELKLPVLKRGKTGPSTDQEVLEKLAEQHPLPRAVIEWRGLSKLKSTYLEPLPTMLGKDGRLHTTFRQAVAATGRLSSVDPNLQNIPIRGEMGPVIRRAFVADPGHVLISADYSQVELRLLAHFSEDPGLIEAFEKDQDVHTRTAAEVFGVPPEAVTPDQRRAAKMVNFGIAYGLSPHGLSTRLDIPQEEAKSIIDRYFERFGGIRRYIEQTIEQARRSGFVETLFGRRRYIPDIHSRNRNAAQAAERAAINMPIQGTAADVIKMAMIRLDRRLQEKHLKARMLLQVHDELLLEAPEEERDEVLALAVDTMSGIVQLRVPLKVEAGAGANWAEAH